MPGAWPAGNQGFVGGTTNAETGLTRLGAREYDPALGRFISVDPLIDRDDPQQLNGYAYANNSPATMTDPDGLRYMEGDSGGWQDSRARPRPKPKPKPAVSIARFRDFGSSCRLERSHCAATAQRAKAKAAYVHRARSHDFGSSCEDSASVCRAVRDRAVQKERVDREREECEASFWCNLGHQAMDVLTSDFLGIASIAVGIVCPVCGLVIGLASAAATCLGGGTVAACATSTSWALRWAGQVSPREPRVRRCIGPVSRRRPSRRRRWTGSMPGWIEAPDA